MAGSSPDDEARQQEETRADDHAAHGSLHSSISLADTPALRLGPIDNEHRDVVAALCVVESGQRTLAARIEIRLVNGIGNGLIPNDEGESDVDPADLADDRDYDVQSIRDWLEAEARSNPFDALRTT